MDQAVPCCQNVATLTKAKSPFSKILALGFYDGPTSGVLQCGTCSAVYEFDMLDWDDDHEVRVFRLARLPPNSLAECVKALRQPEGPRWPVWVPSRWALPADEAREEADREVQRILDKAEATELVLAWVGYGETVLAARRTPAADLAGVRDWFSLDGPADSRDWFSLLGLTKGKKVACP